MEPNFHQGQQTLGIFLVEPQTADAWVVWEVRFELALAVAEDFALAPVQERTVREQWVVHQQPLQAGQRNHRPLLAGGFVGLEPLR